MVNKCAESLDSFYRVRIFKKWSGFSLQCVQLGPDPDFFDQTGPDFCQKSGLLKKLTK